MSKSRPAALSALLAAAPLFLLLVGCNPDAPQSTISPTTETTRDIHSLYLLIFWGAVAVFVVVEALLLYAMLRFRRKPGDGIPRQVHGNRTMEILWTAAPALVLVVIAVPTWQTIFALAEDPPADALNVQVIGHQWWWEFRYPDQGMATANELHVPAGRAVALDLTSADVIHSIQAPQLFQKMDVMPGRHTRITFTPEQPGYYFGQCFELCGVGHANMRFNVVVEDAGAFDAWVQKHKTPPQVSGDLAERGRQLFLTKVFRTEANTPPPYGKTPQWGCAACHKIEGVSAGVIGPDLTSLGERRRLGAGMVEHNRETLARWVRNPQDLKPGVLMPNLEMTDDEIAAVVEFLTTLR